MEEISKESDSYPECLRQRLRGRKHGLPGDTALSWADPKPLAKDALGQRYAWYNPLCYLWALYSFFKNFKRNREHTRSEAIHALETGKDLGVAVVSLPADCEWLLRGYDKDKGVFKEGEDKKRVGAQDFLSEITVNAAQNKNDFCLSDAVKEALGGEGLWGFCEEPFRKSLMVRDE
jgi:hypothetical protein